MPLDLAQAAAALAQDRPAEARPLLESATRLNPRDAMAWALLAQTYWRLKQPMQAAAAAKRVDATSDAKVQHALAIYYAQSGNRKRAAQLETQFARSGDADKTAALRAAMLNLEAGDHVAAIEMGEWALRSEDRLETRQLLARAYEAAGRMDDAIRQRREMVRLSPHSEDAHAELGKLLLRAGRFTAAVVFLEESRASFDKSPQIELELGVALYSLRRFDEAAGRFLRVMELEPAIEQPYVFLARMIDQTPGRVPDLLERAAQWNRREKDNHYAPFVYAKALQAAGGGTDGADRIELLLREAIRRQPKFWESHFELAQVLEQRGNLAGAAAEFQIAVTLNPKQAAPHYRLARIYERLGQKQQAAHQRAIHAQILEAEKGRPGMAEPLAR